MALEDFKTRAGLQVNGALIYAAGGQSNVGIGNNAPDSTLHVEGTINATANGTFGQWTVGNSTVNSFANSTQLRLGNSTVSVAVNSSSISAANGFFTGQVNVGANVIFTTTGATVGNSTVNLVCNSLNITVGNSTVTATVNSTQIQVSGNALVNGTTFFVGNSTNYAVVNTAGFTTTGNLSGTQNAAIEFVMDGGGAALTTGVKGFVELPFPFTINRWTLLADQSGNATVDVWRASYANFPPVLANSITGTLQPNVASTDHNQGTTFTGWTTALSAGDILAFDLSAIDTTITRLTISLKGTRT